MHQDLREKLHVSADLMAEYDLARRVRQWQDKFQGRLELYRDDDRRGGDSLGIIRNEEMIKLIEEKYPKSIETN